MKNQRTLHTRTRLAIIKSRVGAALSSKHALHEARFAHFHELEPLIGTITDPGERLLLGTTRFNQTLAVSKTPDRPELGNMLVVGRTGGGKGLLAIPQLLTWPESVIVNDIKGDLFQYTSGYRATMSDVYVIDPRGTGHRFDPTAGITDESQLNSIATDILQNHKETNPIFTIRATDMQTEVAPRSGTVFGGG